MRKTILLIILAGVIVFCFSFPNLVQSSEDRFRNFARKYDGLLFEEGLDILAMEYKLTRQIVIRLLLEEGFWSERYTDEFISVRYYVNNEDKILFATELADKNGTINFSNIVIMGGEKTNGIYFSPFLQCDFINITNLTFTP